MVSLQPCFVHCMYQMFLLIIFIIYIYIIIYIIIIIILLWEYLSLMTNGTYIHIYQYVHILVCINRDVSSFPDCSKESLLGKKFIAVCCYWVTCLDPWKKKHELRFEVAYLVQLVIKLQDSPLEFYS